MTVLDLKLDDDILDFLVSAGKEVYIDVFKLITHYHEDSISIFEGIVGNDDLHRDDKMDSLYIEGIKFGIEIGNHNLIVMDTEHVQHPLLEIGNVLNTIFLTEHMSVVTAEVWENNKDVDASAYTRFINYVCNLIDGTSQHELTWLISDISPILTARIEEMSVDVIENDIDIMDLRHTFYVTKILTEIPAVKESETFKHYFKSTDWLELDFNTVYNFKADTFISGNDIETGSNELLAALLLTEEGRNSPDKMITDYVEEDVLNAASMVRLKDNIRKGLEKVDYILEELKEYEENGIFHQMSE